MDVLEDHNIPFMIICSIESALPYDVLGIGTRSSSSWPVGRSCSNASGWSSEVRVR